tara:strand:- start:1204 stop:1353 length:150 start_codon:yes stop_codon:yes gene_type:complete
MKVKLNTALGIKGESHAKGATVKVTNEMAAALILSNKAVEVKEKAKAKK